MSTPHLQPIEKPQGIRDRVVRALRAAIISGEMSPGQVYSAPMLAAKFSVSPTPVREAMLDLVKEGLVERQLNRGFRVTEVDEKYLDEISDLRKLIEPPVVRDVVSLIPNEDIPGLRSLAESIVTHAETHNLAEYTETDNAFHLALLGYAGNRRIVRLIRDLRGQVRLTGLKALADRGELAATATEHLDIVDAIDARDSQHVYELMVHHIDQTRSIWAGNDT